MAYLRWLVVLIVVLLGPCAVGAGEGPTAAPTKTVEHVAAQAKHSVAVILYTGRNGKQQGVGSGFVVGDGLIATNFHVIGEARPITVLMPDGAKHEVISVHATDRNLDLAIVRIAAKKLSALPLGDADKLKQGEALVALGHPRGLEHSVVAGVLSGRRDLEGIPMLQLAIPIEQGNSGGPVLDMAGRVVGIVTMKSLTDNLGFAVPSNALQPLLAKPNPIPMERWLTIGALDKNEWKTLHGGRWRQRAGRLHADGAGTGFGGRTLCYWQRPVPKTPFEVTVTVKLDDERGAAGLIFGGDGGDRHYGFYPSGGKLRFTHFNGPDVFTWKILHEDASPHYRPGDWNTLKVRIDKDQIIAYVNEHKVYELAEPELAGKQVGLAKFRETVAEFKHFQAADRVTTLRVNDPVSPQIAKALAAMKLETPPGPKEMAAFLALPEGSQAVLRNEAQRLEKKASRLRELAQALHHERCLAEIKKLARLPEDRIDLVQGALLLAKIDNEELDVEAYRQEVDRLARDIAQGLPKDADEAKRLEGLSKALFQERGFHGSRFEYYTRNNSYLNEVLDDREGLPITLSVLYMELARRLKLNVVGVGLPGHFVVRHQPDKGKPQLLDVYEGGKLMSDEEAAGKVLKLLGRPIQDKDLAAATKKAILVRMAHNLLKVAQHDRDQAGSLRYLDVILALDDDAHEERWVRAVFRFQAGQRQGALEDCDVLLEKAPAGADLDRVRELKRVLERGK